MRLMPLRYVLMPDAAAAAAADGACYADADADIRIADDVFRLLLAADASSPFFAMLDGC